MRLMQLAATCNFTETSSDIKSQLIAGSINDKTTRKGLSEPDLSLDKLLQFAKTLELTDSQNKAVRRTSQTTTVNHVNDSRQRGKQLPNRPKQKRIPPDERSCFNCGAKWPHEGGQTQCPARGSRCSICHKTNHFAKCCKSNDSGNPVHAPAHRSTKRRDQHINHVQTDKDLEYVYTLSDASPEAKLPHTSVKVENAHLTMMLDTGSSINVIDERTFATLRPRPKLQSVNVKIMTYGSSKSLPHLGRFEATFASIHRNCVDTVYVVRGNHRCLLRYSTALQLGLVETINQVCDDEISQMYPSLVDGRVCDLKDYGPCVKIHIDSSVRPKLHRTYRATPYSSKGIAPATALFGREMKTKLPATISHPQTVELEHALKENDKEAKMKMKRYADRKRHAKSRAIVPGTAVLVRQRKRDKLTSPFDHRPYTVIQKKGTMITAQRGDRNITRNSSHFKPVKLETTVIVESDDDENIDSPTGTSSSSAGDSHVTEAARNLYESTSRRATETPPPPPPPPEANAPRTG